MGGYTYVQEHRVVFDCNVYLDVGRLLGSPFSWDEFNAEAARSARLAIPHPQGSWHDSLRAIAVCTSGRFAGQEPLGVWTSDHINSMVEYKAQQSSTEDPITGFAGLGWLQADATGLVDDFVERVVTMSNGGSLGEQFPDSNPPLDHEDGLVYGACRSLAGEDPLSKVYCITNDEDFLLDASEGRLSAHTKVMTPARFVQLVRSARNSLAAQGMRAAGSVI